MKMNATSIKILAEFVYAYKNMLSYSSLAYFVFALIVDNVRQNCPCSIPQPFIKGGIIYSLLHVAYGGQIRKVVNKHLLLALIFT